MHGEHVLSLVKQPPVACHLRVNELSLFHYEGWWEISDAPLIARDNQLTNAIRSKDTFEGALDYRRY